MGLIRQNLALAPRQTKEFAYKALVRSQLEFAVPIWQPYPKTQLEIVFMKHYAPNYMLVSKENISQIKAKPKSSIIFVTQLHQQVLIIVDWDVKPQPKPNLPAVQIKHRRGLDFKSHQGWRVAFLTVPQRHPHL